MSKQNNIAGRIIGVVILLLVAFFFISILSGLFLGGLGSTLGNHTGVVTAVEHNSNIIWDSNLVYFKTVRESSQENKYCVNDEELKMKLIEHQKNKDEITIKFENNFMMWRWDCNGGSSIITAIE